ncbi:MAG: DUF481 domain-containing protein, partial [Candidatus Hydrogenedentes bacterium]|nr:DUF481 domain-containing protein [Candidatus Hydrogenedentota bacterium]
MKRSMTLLFFGMILFVLGAEADVLLLNNGDRISGTLLTVDGGTVHISTPYAGEISLPLEMVTAIETEGTRAVAFSDATIREGTLAQEEGCVGIRIEEAFHAVPSCEITALAATREELDAVLHPPAPRKWSGTVDLGLVLRNGNTDTTDVNFAAGLERAGKRNTLCFDFEAVYGSTDDILNTRRYQSDVQWQYYLREQLYLHFLGLIERDDGRKLDLRLQGGLGLGYDFID